MAYTLTYETIDATTCKVTGFTGTPIDVVVPATFEGRNVVEIGAYAFSSNTTIQTIEMPSIVTIRDSAFNQSSLTSIGDMPSLVTIELYAFNESALSSIGEMPLLEAIGGYAFAQSSIASIGDMPSLVTIGENALYNSALESIGDMPSLSIIGDFAFFGVQMTGLTLSGNAPTFGTNCFYDSLISVIYRSFNASGWPDVPGTVSDSNVPTAYIPQYATLSVTSSAKFSATSLSGTWYPVNGGTGTPVYYEYSIGEAWEVAESTAFNSLRTWLGGTEGKDCFRGYIPFQNVEKKFVDVWMMTSGGTAGAFDIGRTYGINGAWCNVMQNVDIAAMFENRSTAMCFTGAVLAWIRSTNNLNQTVNVNWCRLRNLPEAPRETIEGNRRFWEIRIPLEMLYLTESVYA